MSIDLTPHIGLTVCMRFQDGTLLLNGKTPEELGVPQWRTQVTYVPQSRTQQKGTPSELYYQAQVVGFFCMSSASLLYSTSPPFSSRSRKTPAKISSSMSLCQYSHVLVQQFKAQRGRPRGDLPALVAGLGLEQRVLNQPWVELSVSASRQQHLMCMQS